MTIIIAGKADNNYNTGTARQARGNNTSLGNAVRMDGDG